MAPLSNPSWPPVAGPTTEPFRHRLDVRSQAPDEATERADLARRIDGLLMSAPPVREANLAGLRVRILSGDISILDAEDQIARETQFAAKANGLAPAAVAQSDKQLTTGVRQAPPGENIIDYFGMRVPYGYPAIPIEDAYNKGIAPTYNPAGDLTNTPEGHQLIAPMIVGRRNASGDVWEYDERDIERFWNLAETILGAPITVTGGMVEQNGQMVEDYGELPDRGGGVTYGPDGQVDRLRMSAFLDVDPVAQFPTLIHELAHTFFDTIETDPRYSDVLEQLRPRLYELFGDVNYSPSDDATPAEVFRANNYVYENWTPEEVQRGMLRESLAEFFRIYVMEPNLLYKNYKDLVETLRPILNQHEELNRFLQFAEAPPLAGGSSFA